MALHHDALDDAFLMISTGFLLWFFDVAIMDHHMKALNEGALDDSIDVSLCEAARQYGGLVDGKRGCGLCACAVCHTDVADQSL